MCGPSSLYCPWPTARSINCFFGYKIFKIVLGVLGFIFGGLAAAAMAMAATKEPGIAVLVGLVGGVIGATLMVALYFLGVFVLGALVGGLVGALPPGGRVVGARNPWCPRTIQYKVTAPKTPPKRPPRQPQSDP